MPVLLQINEIHKSFGAVTVLDEASASFSDNQKIGVIGRNGAGKSTLCRIITGHEKADSGTIARNSALRLSYLKQHDTFRAGETVLEFLIHTTEREHWECAELAARFQLKNETLDQSIQSLAGGYQTRVKLAAMLLGNPNFLVLDEPSNYLDLSTLVLLENFLINFRGGYLVVSHDREFLKRTCDHTLEIEGGQITLYPSGIEEYFEFKEEQLAQKRAHNQGVEKKRIQLQAFIDRFRAKASTASRAQSKVKQLAKLKTIEILHPVSSIRIRIPQVEPKAGVAFECHNLAIGYPEKDVARAINLTIDRGERVAILGDNGEGKTTFLRTAAGDLVPKAGNFRWGAGLQIAYYAQHVLSSLHPDDDIYTHLMRASAPNMTNQEILAMAGGFLFKGDDVKKKVKVLSGGERARLILAGLLLTKSHVLLLDEPTNHLDFETVEALGRALRNFLGTVFFISHDRTFVNLIATNIIEVKKGRVTRYPGTYEDYGYHLELMAHEEMEEHPSGASTHSSAKPHDYIPAQKEDPQTVSERAKEKAELKKINSGIAAVKKKMAKAEQRIQHFNQERDKLLEELRKNPFHYSKDRNRRLKELQIGLEESEHEWCSLQGELDRLEKKD